MCPVSPYYSVSWVMVWLSLVLAVVFLILGILYKKKRKRFFAFSVVSLLAVAGFLLVVTFLFKNYCFDVCDFGMC